MSERRSSDDGHGLLHRLAHLGLNQPRWVLSIAGLLLVISGWVAWQLPISTSRYNLVSKENPEQARLENFFERFGYPDSMIFVVSGGNAVARRRFVDAMERRLATQKDLRGKVLSRIGLDQIAEVALLFKPEALGQLQQRLGDEQSLKGLIEGGLPAWIEAMTRMLESGLEGEGSTQVAASTKVVEKQAADSMDGLRFALMALDDELAGRDPMQRMPAIKKRAQKTSNTDALGYLTSSDQSKHFIALFPKLPGAEGHQVAPVVQRLRTLRDEVKKEHPGIQAQLTGMPALGVDELSTVKKGLMQSSWATTLAILVLLYSAFRSLRYTILTLLPLGIGLMLTLAAVLPVFGGLNLITSSFVPVLLALGIDFGVYVLSRYGEQVRAGDPPKTAIARAMALAGPGVLIGSATTVMAFLLTTRTEFTAYSQLGFIVSMGLCFMVLATFILLPALIWMAGKGREIRSPELPGVGYLPALIRKGKWPLLSAAVLLVALSLPAARQIQFNARYFDFLPTHTESAIGLQAIEKDRALSPVTAGMGTPTIAAARALSKKLRALPSVASVHSASDLMPPLTKSRIEHLRKSFAALTLPNFDALRTRQRSTKVLASKLDDLIDMLEEVAAAFRKSDIDTKPVDAAELAARQLKKRVTSTHDEKALERTERHLAELLERAFRSAKRIAERGSYSPKDLPPVFRARFLSKNKQELAVYASPTGNIWNPVVAAKFAHDVKGIDQNVVGLAVSIHDHVRIIKRDFARATLLALGLVFFLLFAAFRKPGDALLALVPTAVGMCVMLGFMRFANLHFNVANVVVPVLILGIGVDAGAHMVHRWRQSRDENDGIARLDDVIRGTGSAVLLASLTTTFGFGALLIADYGGMKSLGLTMSVGVCSCLIASLLILPALMLATKTAK